MLRLLAIVSQKKINSWTAVIIIFDKLIEIYHLLSLSFLPFLEHATQKNQRCNVYAHQCIDVTYTYTLTMCDFHFKRSLHKRKY
jgi:hypothetical protein